MLRITVTLRSNFLHLVTSSQTAFVTQWCYIMALHSCVTLHVCTQLNISNGKFYYSSSKFQQMSATLRLIANISTMHDAALVKFCKFIGKAFFYILPFAAYR